ncbi:kelch motif domain-containing protein [Sarocladium implicatum]|nr:kelch motif domain-containing protein [Sarocladium implicatum]
MESLHAVSDLEPILMRASLIIIGQTLRLRKQLGNMYHLQIAAALSLFSALDYHLVLGQDGSRSTPRPALDDSGEGASSNAPPNDHFLRRAYSSVAVIGDYIYLDGGEISMDNTAEDKHAVNATLAIDLTKPWSPSDVQFIETEYGTGTKQSLSGQAIFVDEGNGSFYTWAGRTTGGADIRDQPALWQFDPDGKGSGSWGKPEVLVDNTINSLPRTFDAAAVGSAGTGFIFGGLSTKDTMNEPIGYSKTWIEYDFGTGTWLEHDDTPYSKSGQIYGGAAVSAHNFTYASLVFVLGGYEDPNKPDTGLGFETVHFMTAATKEWFSQKATGAIPEPRYDFCAVGVESYGSYPYEGPMLDIFIFGGYNAKLETDFSSVHVLSIPSFQWHTASQAVGDNRQRSQHACAVIGGNQMMTWGGRRMVEAESDADAWESKDPFPQGIGLYDLNSFSWDDEYDADTRTYVQNSRISNAYRHIYWPDMKWSSDEVRELLVPTPTETPRPPQEYNDSLKFGAAAGGCVGLLAITSLVAGGFFWRRHQRKREQKTAADTRSKNTPDAELGRDGEISEAPPKTPVFEARGTEAIPRELQGRQILAELEGAIPGPYEVLGDTQAGPRV